MPEACDIMDSHEGTDISVQVARERWGWKRIIYSPDGAAKSFPIIVDADGSWQPVFDGWFRLVGYRLMPKPEQPDEVKRFKIGGYLGVPGSDWEEEIEACSLKDAEEEAKQYVDERVEWWAQEMGANGESE